MQSVALHHSLPGQILLPRAEGNLAEKKNNLVENLWIILHNITYTYHIIIYINILVRPWCPISC